MHERGFTLVELMVVIVVMGILASLLLINLSGVDRRQAMQAREILISDLKLIRRFANEQNMVLSLALQPNQSTWQYQVMSYQAKATELTQKWQIVPQFEQKNLLPDMRLAITPIEQNHNGKNLDLIGQQAPQLMWFGNGEAKPARIQVYWQEQPIGTEIEIDYLGKVHEK